MAASSVIFSAMSLLVPFAAASTYVVAASRFVTGGLAIAAMAALGFIKLRPVNLPWLVVRGLFGSVSVYLFYRGITRLGLGMGTVLNYTYPVFAALLAPLMLKERLQADVIVAVVLSFLGIYLVVNPSGMESVLHGGGPGGLFSFSPDALLSLLGGLFASVAVVSIKRLRETDSPSVIYLAQCVFGALMIGYPTATSSFSFSLSVWLILLAIGGLATVAQVMMTEAYAHVSATEGSLLAYLVPVLNVALGAVVFGETTRPLALAGSVLVLACCAYVALRERIMRLFG
jgi:drug/metabolite transporter (DMT)-like permease